MWQSICSGKLRQDQLRRDLPASDEASNAVASLQATHALGAVGGRGVAPKPQGAAGQLLAHNAIQKRTKQPIYCVHLGSRSSRDGTFRENYSVVFYIRVKLQ